jgi:hypothetical protein
MLLHLGQQGKCSILRTDCALTAWNLAHRAPQKALTCEALVLGQDLLRVLQIAERVAQQEAGLRIGKMPDWSPAEVALLAFARPSRLHRNADHAPCVRY